MPGRPMILFIVAVVGIVALHELNSTLGGLSFLAGVGILLIYLANRAVGPIVPPEKTEQVKVDVFHGGDCYQVSLEVIVVREIGAFYSIATSGEFWEGVFRFPPNAYPPTIQALSEAVGDYALAALQGLNDSISIRYTGECRVGTVSVQPRQIPANVSVG